MLRRHLPVKADLSGRFQAVPLGVVVGSAGAFTVPARTNSRFDIELAKRPDIGDADHVLRWDAMGLMVAG